VEEIADFDDFSNALKADQTAILSSVGTALSKYIASLPDNEGDENTTDKKLLHFFDIAQKEVEVKKSGRAHDKDRIYSPGSQSKYLYRLRQGEGDPKFPKAIYYWFHVFAPKPKYAEMIDHELFGEGVSFEDEYKVRFADKEYPENDTTDEETASDEKQSENLIPPKNQRLRTIHGEGTWLSPRNPDIIEFEGREGELEKLNAFAEHDDNFKLWAIVGPSGAGKTRLMVHWANSEVLNGWEAIEIGSQTRIEWNNWQPQAPTLIVVDYIYGYDQVIIDIVYAARSKTFDHKVRLLILDHATPEKMANLLKDPRWGFDGAENSHFDFVTALFFDEAPLNLKKLDKDDSLLEKIICNITQRATDDSAVIEALQYLADTKGAEQPLFAALVGDAIKNKNDYKARNRRELIRYYLDGKTRLTWQLNTPEGKWAACFVTAATARNGAAFKTLMLAVPSEAQAELQKKFLKFKSLCSGVTANSKTNVLEAFRPDILGESHFLLFLKAIEDGLYDFAEHLRLLISTSDTENVEQAATDFVAFMTKLARNLANDDQDDEDTKIYWHLLNEFLEPNSFSEGSPFRWAVNIALFEISEILKNARQLELCRAFSDKIVVDQIYTLPKEHINILPVVVAIRYFILVSDGTEEIPTALQRLIEAYMEVEDASFHALIICSAYGILPLVKFIIDHGADVNASNKDGATILMLASDAGQKDVAALLIDHGANVNASTEKGWTPLMVASDAGQKDVAALLINHNANVNAATDTGSTSLIHASLYGHRDVAALLINHGADVNAFDKDGITALMAASAEGYRDVAALLIDHDINVNTSAETGWTPLMAASQNGHQDVANLLLDHDAVSVVR